VIVRQAAQLWPHWWNAELFGEPHREAELAPLESLHDGLRRLKGMFRDFEGTAQRVERENEILVDWQRTGAGLPQG